MNKNNLRVYKSRLTNNKVIYEYKIQIETGIIEHATNTIESLVKAILENNFDFLIKIDFKPLNDITYCGEYKILHQKLNKSEIEQFWQSFKKE